MAQWRKSQFLILALLAILSLAVPLGSPGTCPANARGHAALRTCRSAPAETAKPMLCCTRHSREYSRVCCNSAPAAERESRRAFATRFFQRRAVKPASPGRARHPRRRGAAANAACERTAASRLAARRRVIATHQVAIRSRRPRGSRSASFVTQEKKRSLSFVARVEFFPSECAVEKLHRAP